jgi:hypothetical protein
VGHTHEDIDSLFGKISQHVRKQNALSLNELGQMMTQACHTLPMKYQTVDAVNFGVKVIHNDVC